LTVIDLEEDVPSNVALHNRPRDIKSSKANIKCDASALAFGETLKGSMAEKEEELANRDVKRRREKDATCSRFIDLTNMALNIEESIARTKAIDTEAKLLAEENRIMLADLSIMALEQNAWFERNQAIMHAMCDRTLPCMTCLPETCALFPYHLELLHVNYVMH
jgi:hypothetical protein